MKKETHENIGSIILIIVILFLGMLILYDLFESKFNEESKFCIKNGFEKATDRLIVRCRGGEKLIHIECDKKIILVAHYVKDCVKVDKWGRCVWYNYSLEGSNSSCIRR